MEGPERRKKKKKQSKNTLVEPEEPNDERVWSWRELKQPQTESSLLLRQFQVQAPVVQSLLRMEVIYSSLQIVY
jgi:hypothetical protein